MKLKLSKKKMKTLSADNSNLPFNMTPNVAGARVRTTGCAINNSEIGLTHCLEFTCGVDGCRGTI
ncbi:hypothetical protein [Pseudoalteromonas rubra]|uniref:hypothetical protein n=1 Tax=Pseudoalteromonas rubra TaxID=43658 RepID=UPI00026CA863|nr:hypothetical protein [Pseudoalteromonas rubra]